MCLSDRNSLSSVSFSTFGSHLFLANEYYEQREVFNTRKTYWGVDDLKITSSIFVDLKNNTISGGCILAEYFTSFTVLNCEFYDTYAESCGAIAAYSNSYGMIIDFHSNCFIKCRAVYDAATFTFDLNNINPDYQKISLTTISKVSSNDYNFKMWEGNQTINQFNSSYSSTTSVSPLGLVSSSNTSEYQYMLFSHSIGTSKGLMVMNEAAAYVLKTMKYCSFIHNEIMDCIYIYYHDSLLLENSIIKENNDVFGIFRMD